MNRPPSWVSTTLRAAVRMLPQHLRERHGEEIVQLFEDEWNDRPPLSRWTYFARTLVGLVVASLPTGSFEAGYAQGLVADLRVTWRGILRRPALSFAIVATLVLGIGLNTAMFSIVNGLLLRPLPYAEPSRLLQLSQTAPDIESMDLSLPDYAVWRERTEVFEGMFAFDDATFLLATADRPEILEGAQVSPGFLGVLGIDPLIGRGFDFDEEHPGQDRVVIISHALWERRFGGDPAALGQTLELNGRSRMIVGVAPAGFQFPEYAHVWVPLAFDPSTADPEDYSWDVIGRLKQGERLDSALAEGELVAAELASMAGGAKDGLGATAYPLRAADVPAALAFAVLLLQVAVVMVLVVACSNVASLLLVSGEERRGETQVRRALGAGGFRILRQQFIEVGVYAVTGLAGAVVIARLAVERLPALFPGEPPFWLRFDLDPRVLLWSCGLGLLSTLVVLVPTAAQALGHRPELASNASNRVLGRRRRSWLVAAQIGAATLLVGIASVASVSLRELTRVDPGFNTEKMLVMSAPLPPRPYPDAESRLRLMREVLSSTASVPGVQSVAAVGGVPLLSSGEEVALEGGLARPSSTGERTRAPVGLLNSFSPNYFETMGIPLVTGRLPSGDEAWTDQRWAVVSQSLAERLWPEQGAVGQLVRFGTPGSRAPKVANDRPWFEVVGVVGDVMQGGPVRSPRDELYVTMGSLAPRSITLMVRTTAEPDALVEPIQSAVHELDPTIPFREPTTMADARRYSVWMQTLTAGMLTGFAVLAGGMALLGIYSAVAYYSRRRRREIGLRVAVGATRSAVRLLILRQSMRLILPGLCGGSLGAVAGSLLLGSVVAGVDGSRPLLLLATASAFASAAVAAAMLPAWRASRVDPTVALAGD